VQTVAIVGVGLIGGSFALALREAGFTGAVLGVSSPGAIRDALEMGVIDRAVSLDEAAQQADLLYLTKPILGILDTLEQLRGKLSPGALVTDGGSTKLAIVEKAMTCITPGQFIGGHPVAGKEISGVGAAEAGLFRGKPYVLTPTDTSQLDSPPVRELMHWIERIGAKLMTLPPAEHDRILASTSHLPQLISTVLAAMLHPEDRPVAGTGLAGMLRLAHSPYSVWGDIFATNRVEVDRALAAYVAALENARYQLAAANLEPLFDRANEAAKTLGPRNGA
jgi:prephenate dehydrogenase